MDLPPPQPACIALLPVLLSPTPRAIPGSQLSQLTRSAHHYLSTPVTSPAYLQPVQVDYEVTRLREELTESISDPPLGDPLYAADASAIRALIPIGSSSLAVVLVWEEESVHPFGGAFADLGNGSSSAFARSEDQDEQGLAGWRFLTLDRIDPDSPSAKHWSTDLRTALDGLARQLSEGVVEAAGTGGSKKKSVGTGPMTIKTPKVPIQSREEMAEGEGTTPGAYGAPEDFWEGWEEEDDHSEGGGGDHPSGVPGGSVGGAYGTRPLTLEEKEAAQESSYWESYGSDASGSVIGDDDDAHDRTRTNTHHQESDAQLLPMDADDPDFASLSRRASAVAPGSPFTRSRRSSTIRGADAPVVMDALRLAGAIRPSPSRTPSNITSSSDGISTTNGTPLAQCPDPEEEKTIPTLPTSSLVGADSSPDVDALRFALAGVWQLFSKGSTPAERDLQRDTFLRISNMVTKS
ncbi:BZ3500_MvSof-1268-A1-R1_Chr2-1g04692 [Microbotryum saponariae]|uniref:BZ3500_MvSof-1268-A1-R1_Chr2-1g04692 protein n=1 Tax=Microbotryum saponariae TaxID=289078 RepID=A0A2X0KDS1_9BASI|nr:BZ3500_MvSof-1268-A1-R1_Chr2-1g04692 [Microbotryum saponariae]SCZ92334.1 BZ3501_MvSof-1269-A2-R1_Chr2-1g04348 [Microbotryum saponariae]